MLRQMIYTQWKWSKLELGVYSVLGFVIPVVTMKLLTMKVTSADSVIPIGSLLDASVGTGIFLLILALLCSVSLAVRPWVTDNARAHVLALSLPLRWAEFIRLRFLAGAALLLAPTLAVWFGGVLAAVSMPIPSSLHAYPTSVAARFLAGALVMYAAVFAFQHLAGRRAAKVAAGILVALLVAELVAQATRLPSPFLFLWHIATSWPGPFEVMTARWMIIDV